MLPIRDVKSVGVDDWDNLVKVTYGKPYSFQQQDGCRDRGTFYLSVPSDEDENFPEITPEQVSECGYGVALSSWLNQEVGVPLGGATSNWEIEMFWERNFYPSIYSVANDLHKRGLVDAGEYAIDIDW